MNDACPRVVLGIDAAWTATQPSGVALAAECHGRWRLVAVEPSYARFHARAAVLPLPRPAGSLPVAADLLASAATLAGRPVDLIAIDMPLSRASITGRRASDNAVSRAYGARKCSTHSPSAIRPGRLSDDLRAAFEAAGYKLRTTALASPGLIEVYPHPALVEFAAAAERLPYKAAKSTKYWPEQTLAERRASLLRQWHAITALLDRRLDGVLAALPPPTTQFKAHEDALDAVICACVAIAALQGQAIPFGDVTSTIWIPISGERPQALETT